DAHHHAHQNGDGIPHRQALLHLDGFGLTAGRRGSGHCVAPAHSRDPLRFCEAPRSDTSRLPPCTLPVKWRASAPSPTLSSSVAPFSLPLTGQRWPPAPCAVPRTCWKSCVRSSSRPPSGVSSFHRPETCAGTTHMYTARP